GMPSLRTGTQSSGAPSAQAPPYATVTPPRGRASTRTSGRFAYAGSIAASRRPASLRSRKGSEFMAPSTGRMRRWQSHRHHDGAFSDRQVQRGVQLKVTLEPHVQPIGIGVPVKKEIVVRAWRFDPEGPGAARALARRPRGAERTSFVMYIAYTPEQEALRAELRTYFAELMTPEVEAEVARGDTGGPHCLEAVRKMGRDGWLGIGWPTEYGGQGR